MFNLVRYSENSLRDDDQKYREAISVTLGDEKARWSWMKRISKLGRSGQGFVEGRPS